jgi:cation:H+ antiporter
VDLLILVGAFAVILVGAELFTNGIEWVGRKLDLAEGAVGSVLAAIGTALPETMIPVIAILFSGSASSHDVGVGAILGAPLMLSTLGMFVTGIAILWVARRRSTGDVLQVDTVVLSHDIRFFGIAYALAIAAAFLPLNPIWLKWIVAAVLIGIYAWYVKGHFDAEAKADAEELERLRFHPLDREAHRADPATPRLRIVVMQVAVALGLIVLGAMFFVLIQRLTSAGWSVTVRRTAEFFMSSIWIMFFLFLPILAVKGNSRPYPGMAEEIIANRSGNLKVCEKMPMGLG